MSSTLNKRNFIIINTLLLVIIFLLSIWLRLPNIKETQYLGKNHEWITAHVLLTNKIWNEGGVGNYYWAPVYTYNNKIDKTHPLFSHLIDKNYNRYYASYPPLVFYVPYFIFKITNSTPNVLGIRIINLALQFISGFLLALIIFFIGNKSFDKVIYLPAIIGFTLYMFNTTNLWVNGNLYFSDMLAQPFFIAIVYFLLLYINTPNEKFKRKYAIFLIILSFLIVYSEWIGVFLLFTVFIVLLFFIQKNKKTIFLILLMPISGIAALIVTAFQYSLISGWSNFSSFVAQKYLQRSGAHGFAQGNFTLSNPVARDALKNYYVDGYLPVFYFLLLIVFISTTIFFSAKRPKICFNKNLLIALVLAILPVVLHTIILFNFNSWHNFSVHKSSFPIVLILGGFLGYIFKKLEFQNKFLVAFVDIFIAFSTLLTSFFSYQEYIKQSNPTYNLRINYSAAEMIKKYANPDDVVFSDVSFCPELMFYSGRNTFTTETIEESIEYMKGLDHAKNGVFIKRYGQDIEAVYRFNITGEIHEIWKRKN